MGTYNIDNFLWEITHESFKLFKIVQGNLLKFWYLKTTRTKCETKSVFLTMKKLYYANSEVDYIVI